MEVPDESWAIGPNPNADPAYIIIIVLLPDTVGHAGRFTSALKHKQGEYAVSMVMRLVCSSCSGLVWTVMTTFFFCNF